MDLAVGMFLFSCFHAVKGILVGAYLDTISMTLLWGCSNEKGNNQSLSLAKKNKDSAKPNNVRPWDTGCFSVQCNFLYYIHCCLIKRRVKVGKYFFVNKKICYILKDINWYTSMKPNFFQVATLKKSQVTTSKSFYRVHIKRPID